MSTPQRATIYVRVSGEWPQSRCAGSGRSQRRRWLVRALEAGGLIAEVEAMIEYRFRYLVTPHGGQDAD
jgi:hypothetical protein